MGNSLLSSLNTCCSFAKVLSNIISKVQRCLIQFLPLCTKFNAHCVTIRHRVINRATFCFSVAVPLAPSRLVLAIFISNDWELKRIQQTPQWRFFLWAFLPSIYVLLQVGRLLRGDVLWVRCSETHFLNSPLQNRDRTLWAPRQGWMWGSVSLLGVRALWKWWRTIKRWAGRVASDLASFLKRGRQGAATFFCALGCLIHVFLGIEILYLICGLAIVIFDTVSYTHLRAHET